MVSLDLREKTKENHQALEKHVILQLKQIKSSEDYTAFLRNFYVYFNSVEQAIAPFITNEVLADYADRRNSSYIKSDIEALGGNVENLPIVEVPQITNTREALGALYVMEGSIMGGKTIVQILEKHGVTDGVSFFSGYGESTGSMWKIFTDVLNANAVADNEKTEMVAAANSTFECFGKVFETITA